MARLIHREDVLKLMQKGAQVVEVLPPRSYEEQHLPGAINIPLARLTPETASNLKPEQPVIVYCHDFQ